MLFVYCVSKMCSRDLQLIVKSSCNLSANRCTVFFLPNNMPYEWITNLTKQKHCQTSAGHHVPVNEVKKGSTYPAGYATRPVFGSQERLLPADTVIPRTFSNVTCHRQIKVISLAYTDSWTTCGRKACTHANTKIHCYIVHLLGLPNGESVKR